MGADFVHSLVHGGLPFRGCPEPRFCRRPLRFCTGMGFCEPCSVGARSYTADVAHRNKAKSGVAQKKPAQKESSTAKQAHAAPARPLAWQQFQELNFSFVRGAPWRVHPRADRGAVPDAVQRGAAGARRRRGATIRLRPTSGLRPTAASAVTAGGRRPKRRLRSRTTGSVQLAVASPARWRADINTATGRPCLVIVTDAPVPLTSAIAR